MTETLYYEYPTVTECSAEVVSCEEKDGVYALVLTRSPIFPEGGGQLADGGRVFTDKKSAGILDCRTVNGETVHYMDSPFEVGERVAVRLDLEKRLDHAEQHTGEHILSGLASKLFSAKNIGFHMAADYCTIDLDLPLEKEQLEALEIEANRAVRADLSVHTEVTDGEDASKRTLRKRAEKAVGEVRIVYIDHGKVDSCTCCGTHLHTTGMVGAIRITDAQHYKGGTRLFFACGNRAARLSIDEHAAMSELARKYSTSREGLPAAIYKQMDEVNALKSELKQKSTLLAAKTADELMKNAEVKGGASIVFDSLEGVGANDLKLILEELSRRAEVEKATFAALLFAPSKDGTDYRMACSAGFKLSMKELCSAVNAALNGKGGGSPVFAQGKSERKLDEGTFDALRSYLMAAAG
ncbi:MAG: hypothetical protein IKZ82_03955 [Clostridia bacterium]|nr:hypothetical protein [Clostridia bacterium]